MSWMQKVKRWPGEKVTVINELDFDTEKLKKKINKRKSWTALRDGWSCTPSTFGETS